MIQYTNPQPLALYFWEQIPQGVTNIEDLESLENPVVTIQTGSVGFEKYLRQYPFIIIKSLDQYVEVILDLKTGKSLAGCCDLNVASYMKTKTPELQLLVLQGSEKLHRGDGIGVNKKNKKIYDDVQAAITTLQNNGTLNSLKEKWFANKGAH
jgi:ABC-type amino acid transport substrate-binding protein